MQKRQILDFPVSQGFTIITEACTQYYEDAVETLAKKSNNPRWDWVCYRRFIQMFSDVVKGVKKEYFEKLIEIMKEQLFIKEKM